MHTTIIWLQPQWYSACKQTNAVKRDELLQKRNTVADSAQCLLECKVHCTLTVVAAKVSAGHNQQVLAAFKLKIPPDNPWHKLLMAAQGSRYAPECFQIDGR
jgi:hypothetical protein